MDSDAPDFVHPDKVPVSNPPLTMPPMASAEFSVAVEEVSAGLSGEPLSTRPGSPHALKRAVTTTSENLEDGLLMHAPSGAKRGKAGFLLRGVRELQALGVKTFCFSCVRVSGWERYGERLHKRPNAGR
jgi:hypothetical protein